MTDRVRDDVREVSEFIHSVSPEFSEPDVKRREFLALAAAIPALTARTRSVGAALLPPPMPPVDPLLAAAREAYVYTLPLIRLAALRNIAIQAGRAVNVFHHRSGLSTPQTEFVTASNNDTLSSSAFLDLSGDSVDISLPVTGQRYFSLQLMDAWTNTFCVLGTRTTGPAGGTYTLVGPAAPFTPRAIRSPTRWVWALGRLLLDGTADLPAANALQQQLVVHARACTPMPEKVASGGAGWQDFFSSAQIQLIKNPPPATDDALLRRIAVLGITPGGGFDPRRFTAEEGARIAAGMAAGRAIARDVAGVSRIKNGWAYHDPQIGAYGQDYRLRAVTCQWGIGALVPQEAMYIRAAGESGEFTYRGGHAYRLHFPRNGRPPVGAFWSLTLYRPTQDSQVFFYENAQHRYSLGDRSGLVANDDGSLDLWIASTDPGGRRTANWLPAPSSGRFTLVMRAYLPDRTLLDGSYLLPEIEPV
jgi:hypothetical protein